MDAATTDKALRDYLDGRQGNRKFLGRRIEPYVGLRHFDVGTARLLFGRAGAAEAILSKFETAPVVFVIGGSGCGKSSIVRGRVMETLRLVMRPVQGRRGAWMAADTRPMLHPLDALINAVWAQIFRPFYPDEDTDEAAHARSILDSVFGVDQHGMRNRIEAALRAPLPKSEDAPRHRGLETVRAWLDRLDHGLEAGSEATIPLPVDSDPSAAPPRPRSDPRIGSVNLMLLIDQFEEIFRPEVAPEQRRAVVAMIRHVFLEKPEGVFLAITMRAEDVHRCAEEPDLDDIFNSSQHLVGWLGDQELREAVVEPARTVFAAWGIALDRDDPSAPYEDATVNRIVSHVKELQRGLEHKSDHLPLFQHWLTLLWRRAADRWDSDARHAREKGRPALVPCVTESDLNRTIATATGTAGQDSNWMARALEATVESGVDEACKLFAARLEAVASTKAGEGSWRQLNKEALARASLRAAMTAMASKDEHGRYHRRFVRPEEVAKDRLGRLFDHAELSVAADALDAALKVLAEQRLGLLSRSEDGRGAIYDVTHEALIRNSSRLGRWLQQDADIVDALVRVFERNHRLGEQSSKGEAVQPEDLPPLAILFDACPDLSATARSRASEAIGSDRTNPEDLRQEARRLYALTHNAERLAETACERFPPDTRLEVDDLLDEVKRLYLDRRGADAQKARRRSLRFFISGGLVCTAGIAIGAALFYQFRSELSTELADLNSIYATAPLPRDRNQLIGDKLRELKDGAEKFPRSADRKMSGVAGMVLDESELVEARFRAHFGINEQMRELFGHAFQLRTAELNKDATLNKDNASEAPVGHACIEAADIEANDSPAQGNIGDWDFRLDKSDEAGILEVKLKRKGADIEWTSDSPKERLQVRYMKPPARVCLDARGRVLVIVRTAANGGHRPVPEINILHLVDPATPDAGEAISDQTPLLELIPIRDGDVYHPTDDVRIPRRSGSQPRQTDIKAIYQDSALGLVVRFRHGPTPENGTLLEAVFRPDLIRPALGDTNQKGLDIIEKPERGQIVSHEFAATTYGSEVELEGLIVQLGLDNCQRDYLINVTVLIREGLATRKKTSCKEKSTDTSDVKVSRRLATFRGEPVSHAKIDDEDDGIKLVVKTESDRVLEFPVVFSPVKHLRVIRRFGIEPAADDNRRSSE